MYLCGINFSKMTEKISLNLELLERSSDMLNACSPLRIEIVNLLQMTKNDCKSNSKAS